MAQTQDITLTRVLDKTIKPYRSIDGSHVVKVMAQAPFTDTLRTKNRIATSDTFSTGSNIFD